jgi:aminodeoxychorismate synthase component I
VIEPLRAFHDAAARDRVAFLDGGIGLPRAPLSHLAWDPVRTLRVHATASVTIDGRPGPDAPLVAIDGFLAEESRAGRTVIGAIAYELGNVLEPRPRLRRTPDVSLVVLSSYRRSATFDATDGRWTAPVPSERGDSRPFRASCPRPLMDFGGYEERFRRLQEWIAAGDVYQANLSVGFEAAFDGDPAGLYESLAQVSPVPYGAYVDCGDLKLLCNSPELFLARRGRRLVTRPIKGTRPRGRSPAEDARLVAELRRDPKERAEHVMIVDLERNDLGRIARTGTVTVEGLESVETYATLHHLESVVAGEASPKLSFSRILRAVFPGGSITGAPKIRAMEILEELEPTARGFYTGAILHYPPSGDFTMNVAIRTATIVGSRIRFAAGGGIVADSRAEAEYEECLLKAGAFLRAARASPTR